MYLTASSTCAPSSLAPQPPHHHLYRSRPIITCTAAAPSSLVPQPPHHRLYRSRPIITCTAAAPSSLGLPPPHLLLLLLLPQVLEQSDRAYEYITSRRVEAPERFQSIQTYRTTIALLAQQLQFVHELEAGVCVWGGAWEYVLPLCFFLVVGVQVAWWRTARWTS